MKVSAPRGCLIRQVVAPPLPSVLLRVPLDVGDSDRGRGTGIRRMEASMVIDVVPYLSPQVHIVSPGTAAPAASTGQAFEQGQHRVQLGTYRGLARARQGAKHSSRVARVSYNHEAPACPCCNIPMH
eukprot:7962660-Pyramimonas_sp.AAC.2